MSFNVRIVSTYGQPQLAVSLIPDDICYHCRCALDDANASLQWANGAWRAFHIGCVFR